MSEVVYGMRVEADEVTPEELGDALRATITNHMKEFPGAERLWVSLHIRDEEPE